MFLSIVVGGLSVYLFYEKLSHKRDAAKALSQKALPFTGNAELDKTLTDVAQQLAQLRRLLNLYKKTLGKMYPPTQAVVTITEQIIEQVQKNPACANGMNQFFSYTFPTTVKLVQRYCELRQEPLQGQNIKTSLRKIENMMDTIVGVFHRQLDALFQKEALDIEVEIQVMRTMFSQDEIFADRTDNPDTTT